MWKKVLPIVAIAIAGVLLAVVVIDMVRSGSGPSGAQQARDEQMAPLIAMDASLREAGTTTVGFHADLRASSGVGRFAWLGSSKIEWADQPLTDTTFTEIKSDAAGPVVEARRVFDGTEPYYRSAAFEPRDGKPWINGVRTALAWAHPLTDPELHLPDYAMWQSFIRVVPEGNAYSAVTEDLEDLAGAPHEYRLTCKPLEDDGCPPPFPSPLDQFFNVAPQTTWSIWLGDDGLPRRVDVNSLLIFDPELAQPGDSNATAAERQYEFTARFEFSA